VGVFVYPKQLLPKNAINSDGQKRRFALFLSAGYGER
jgi:hypothetical protein